MIQYYYYFFSGMHEFYRKRFMNAINFTGLLKAGSGTYRMRLKEPSLIIKWRLPTMKSAKTTLR